MQLQISDFIDLLEREFPEINKGVLKEDTVIEQVIEMSSMNALILISLVKTEYGVSLHAKDLLQAKTVRDLYDIILSRQ